MTATHAASSPLKTSVTALIGGIVIVAIILAILVYFDVHLKLIALLQWIEQQGAAAALLFIAIMALSVVLIFPGVLLTTGAGYVFGITAGTAYVVVGTTVGAAIAFLLARHLFGARAKKYVMGKSKLDLVNKEMTKHDFKVVLLTRLIPFFPGKLSNYVFGLTDFRFWRYVAASLLGYIPFSLHNVYVGSLVSDLAEMSQGGLTRSPLQWALYGFGFIATLVAIYYFNSIAKRALEGYTAGTDQGVP